MGPVSSDLCYALYLLRTLILNIGRQSALLELEIIKLARQLDAL